MHRNNPLLDRARGYSNQGNKVPFEKNSLINKNAHVRNELDTHIKEYRRTKESDIGNLSLNNLSLEQSKELLDSIRDKTASGKKINIIEEMLKPMAIDKNNNDINQNYKLRADKQTKYIVKRHANEKVPGEFSEEFVMTNVPYKNIIKDKIISKPVQDVREEDIVVHRVDRNVDANMERFQQELNNKQIEKTEILNRLEVEFSKDKYETHKKNFEYSQSFVRSIPYEGKDDNKEDYIKYCRKKQKEAEEGLELCDKILRNLKINSEKIESSFGDLN